MEESPYTEHQVHKMRALFKLCAVFCGIAVVAGIITFISKPTNKDIYFIVPLTPLVFAFGTFGYMGVRYKVLGGLYDPAFFGRRAQIMGAIFLALAVYILYTVAEAALKVEFIRVPGLKSEVVFGVFFLGAGVVALIAKIFKFKAIFSYSEIYEGGFGPKLGPFLHTMMYAVLPIIFGAGLLLGTDEGRKWVSIARETRYIMIAIMIIVVPIGYKIWLYIRFKLQMKDTDFVVGTIATFLLDNLRAEHPVPFKDKLDSSALNYSIESLRSVDEYLQHVRSHLKKLSDEEHTKVILRCGAYCGEVLKKELAKRNEKAQWLMYKNALNYVPSIKNFGESTVTFYVLHQPVKETIWFPMAKVEKFLQAGMSESLYMYAERSLEE